MSFLHKNDGNRFGNWGWAVFETRGLILTPILSNAAQYLNRLTDLNKYFQY